jgi:hypothetical protein
MLNKPNLLYNCLQRKFQTCVRFNFCHFQVDALTTERGKEGGWVIERLLNQVNFFLLFGSKEKSSDFLVIITR